jgi:chromosome segregation ATPase
MAKATPQQQIDIPATVATIAGELSGLQTEHERLTGAIEQAEASREAAKARYETALAVGDEKRMSAALASSRKAVVDVPRLEAERVALADKLRDLDQRREQVLGVARERSRNAEAALESARAAREAAEADLSRCAALLGQINEARRLVSPAPAPEAVPARDYTDGPISKMPDGPYRVLA